MKVEIETRIGGIPSIIKGVIHPEEGDNWNAPYIPAHVEEMFVMNMRGKPCGWRKARMTSEDSARIEQELIDEYRRQYAEIY